MSRGRNLFGLVCGCRARHLRDHARAEAVRPENILLRILLLTLLLTLLLNRRPLIFAFISLLATGATGA